MLHYLDYSIGRIIFFRGPDDISIKGNRKIW
jgi:hypothetical protein